MRHLFRERPTLAQRPSTILLFVSIALAGLGCLEPLQRACPDPADRFVPGSNPDDSFEAQFGDTGADTASLAARCRDVSDECTLDGAITLVECRGLTDPWCDSAYIGHYCVETAALLSWLDATGNRDHLLCSNVREPTEPHGWFVECRE